MQAAHDAPGIPLHIGYVFQRIIGLVNAGVEKDIQVDPADNDNPVKVPAKGAKLVHGIQLGTESPVENVFDAFKCFLGNGTQATHV